MIRDVKGHLLYAEAQPLTQLLSPLTSELCAIKEALCYHILTNIYCMKIYHIVPVGAILYRKASIVDLTPRIMGTLYISKSAKHLYNFQYMSRFILCKRPK